MLAAAALVVQSKNHGVSLIAGWEHFVMILCIVVGRSKCCMEGVGGGVVPGKMCGVKSKGS